MDSSNHSTSRHRAALKQSNDIAHLSHSSSLDGSPNPFTSIAKPSHSGGARYPRSTQTVSVGWEEGEDTVSQGTSRLRIELAECVETKTVTTTTTTKRSYPPLLVHQRPLSRLDSKEYPLARKDTPPELAKLSFKFDGDHMDVREDFRHTFGRESSHTDSLDPSALLCKYEDELGSIQAQQAYRTPDFEKSVSDRARPANRKRDPAKNKKLSGRLPEIPPKSPVSLDAKPRRLKHKSDRQARSPNLQIRKNKTSFEHGLGMHLSHTTKLPSTPDISELEPSVDDRSQLGPASSFFQDTYTPQSGLSQNDSFDEVESPSDATDQEIFASSVATPPIAESDLEPFIDIDTAVTHASSGQRPTVNTAAQNASLPSPGLSPAYYDDFSDDNIADEGILDGASPTTQSGDSQGTCFQEHLPRGRRSVSSHSLQQFGEASALQRSGVPTMTNSRAMIESFDAMPDEMKSLMMYQFLRRCHKKTLHLVANVVNPALKCDYLDELPLELSLHILTFLDHRDLCRAAQVSKKWRDVIDSNETGWKELFDRDGFVLPAGELEKAIKQGWGWQDPYGPDGYEQDFSVPELSSEMGSSTVLGYKVENEMVRKIRSGTKRKRTSNSLNPDRAKRNTEKVHGLISMNPPTSKFKSEGPLTAANVAAQAVPDPCVGLASLRKLHLYKSLYRRHSMLQRSWTSGKVAPHHFAFAAHPTHVITCLQFDDDKILTGSDDTMIHVYDTRTGALRNKLAGHDGGVWALQYEGNVLVSGSTDRSVRVWDIEKGLCTQVFHGHTSTVRCLQILMPEPTGSFENGKPVMLPEKPLIITGSRDSQLRVWRLPEQGSKRYIQTGPPANDADCPYFVRVLVGHSHSVRAIAAFQDTLVSGSYDSTVRVWKISTGETVHRLQGHAAKVYSVVLDHKRNRCISGSMDNFVKIWSLDTGACLFTLEGHSSLVGLLDLRDERLVSAAADSTLRIWDPENGQCKSTLTAHTGAITCFQHDGHKVISGSDRTLKMWNVKTGECIQDLLTDLSGVWQVKFDERRCVAAVQRHNLTYIEVLDFGASRDGIPAPERGFRKELSSEESRVVEDEA